MQVGLLRHGEVEGGPRFNGHTDARLTGRGWARMHETAAAHGPWDRVFSSPLDRCAGFARNYARRHALPLVVDERLREMHFGAWEGRSMAAIEAGGGGAALARFWRDPERHPPPGAEPLADFRARVLAAWTDITAAPGEGRSLVVTHGGVIRVLLCHLQGRPAADLALFQVAPASLHLVTVAPCAGT